MSDLQSFIEYEKTRAAEAGKEVAHDPFVFSSIKRWDRLSGKEREAFLERYNRVCADAMGAPLIGFEYFQKAPSENGTRSIARHSNSDAFLGHAIQINNHPDVIGEVTVEEAVGISPHELAHEYQRNSVKQPNILPERFQKTIPPLFERNFSDYERLRPDGSNWNAYRHQDVEEHAFAVGETFTHALIESVVSQDYLRNPFKDEKPLSEFCKGRVELSHSNGIETQDPYRHFYYAVLKEQELGIRNNGHVNDPDWREALSHYAKAARYGEYLIPHDPSPAVRGIIRLARNDHGNDMQYFENTKVRQVPEYIQRQAREYLDEFATSDRASIRLPAKVALEMIRRQEAAANTASIPVSGIVNRAPIPAPQA